jgi:hypothetical protein
LSTESTRSCREFGKKLLKEETIGLERAKPVGMQASTDVAVLAAGGSGVIVLLAT